MDTFVCPYSSLPIPEGRCCEVGSCTFNLEDVPVSSPYRRYFLRYVKATNFNPYQIDELEQVEYGLLPREHKEQIALMFLDLEDAGDAKRSFYMAIFSIMAHDTTVSLPKRMLDPVAYRQCSVCGLESDCLWVPKAGILPSGWGYCSWNCWQLLPPPLLSIMMILEVDFEDLARNLPFPHGQKSRLVFANHLTQWVMGEACLR